MCDQCFETFHKLRDLKAHKKSVHPHLEQNIGFECYLCHTTYASRTLLRSHMWNHTQKKSIECTICHKMLNYRAYLTHYRSHLDMCSTYCCSYCDKTFKLPRYLKVI